MKPRNREITIFNVSMLDVISGAVGAFLILMVVLFPSYQKTHGETDREAEEVENRNRQLRAQLASLGNTERLDEARLQRDRKELEQESREIERSTKSARQAQQKKKKAQGATPGGGEGLALITFFASWQEPVNDRERGELQAFLIPGPMGLSAVDHDSLAGQFCGSFSRGGPPNVGQLATRYARKSAAVLNRLRFGFYAILYCRKSAAKGPANGRAVEVSGHLNYGLAIRPVPPVKVGLGGTIGGFVLLEGNNIKVMTVEEERARRVAQRKKRPSRGTLFRGLEELMTPGKQGPPGKAPRPESRQGR